MKSFKFPWRYIFTLSIFGMLAYVSPPDTRAVDAFTEHYNNARTGATLDETALSTANVGSNTFGKRFVNSPICQGPLMYIAMFPRSNSW